MKKHHLAMPLLMSLAACRSFPDRDRALLIEKCSPDLVMDDLEGRYISVEKSRCNCRSWGLSLAAVGFTGPTIKRPIMYCQKIIGATPRDYGQEISFAQTLRDDLAEYPRKKVEP